MTTPTFLFKSLAIAIASLSVASVANAAGLDRSGQDVSAFLQDGTYAEAVYTYIDADVTGYDNAYAGMQDLNRFDKGKKIDDIAESYDFFRYGVKTDVNDSISVGVLYDEPFGAAAVYGGDNNFVSPTFNTATGGAALREAGIKAKQTAGQAIAAGRNPQTDPAVQAAVAQLATLGGEIASSGEATQVEVRSYNLTGLVGAKLGNGFQVYGGPAIQRVEGEVALRGSAYQTAAGYDARISPDDALGWVVGASYSKPEIGLKAALTYRSEIEHNNTIDEQMPALNYLPEAAQIAAKQAIATNKVGKIDITTPESYNLDFQTGINPTTLATAKVRYVPWGDFAIVPPMYNGASKLNYGKDGLPLVDYDKDQWQVELGLAKRLTPALAVSGSIGWDSGAGDHTTSLGPIDGYYSVGAGAKFNLNKNWAISAGGKYLMFGDAKGIVPTKKVVSHFEDNNGYALGVKLSYQAQ